MFKEILSRILPDFVAITKAPEVFRLVRDEMRDAQARKQAEGKTTRRALDSKSMGAKRKR